jgi:hypothetical protein
MAGRWILGGGTDGGNGGEADNSTATAVVAAALTAYAEVEKMLQTTAAAVPKPKREGNEGG